VPEDTVDTGFNSHTNCDPNTDRCIAHAARCYPFGNLDPNTITNGKQP
jgi:hypothetical protein